VRPGNRFTLQALVLSAMWAAAGLARAQAVSEMDVRAAVLLQLANYTEWPAVAFRSPQDPLQFCVLGDGRLAAALSAAGRDRKVYGHPVAVRLAADSRETSACHVLFIRYSGERQIRDVVLSLRSSPILTVGETERFIDCGGILNLTWENGSVRFEVNQDGARSAGLILSSRLLRLARLHGSRGEN
jgi:hypothetical protein